MLDPCLPSKHPIPQSPTTPFLQKALGTDPAGKASRSLPNGLSIQINKTANWLSQHFLVKMHNSVVFSKTECLKGWPGPVRGPRDLPRAQRSHQLSQQCPDAVSLCHSHSLLVNCCGVLVQLQRRMAKVL